MLENQKVKKQYSKEFKEQTAKSIVEGQKKVSAVSRETGINENVLYRLKNDYIENKENAYPGKGNRRPKESEIHRLNQENRDLREERDILKKALAIFSKQPK